MQAPWIFLLEAPQQISLNFLRLRKSDMYSVSTFGNLSRGIVPEFGVRLVSWNTVGREHFILRTYCVSSEVYCSRTYCTLLLVSFCCLFTCVALLCSTYNVWELCYQLSLAHPFKLHSLNSLGSTLRAQLTSNPDYRLRFSLLQERGMTGSGLRR